MKVVVDTTYVLPLLGIVQEKVPADLVARLREKGHEVFLNEISIFEAMAIAAKRCSASEMGEDDVLTGVSVLASEDNLVKVAISEPEVCLRALLARRRMRDFVDCVILGTGAWAGNLLVTEDQDIQAFPAEHLLPLYPEFKVVDQRGACEILDL